MAERTLTVKIIGDSRSLQREFARSSRSASQFNRDINRVTRGAIVGTGVFRGLGNAATFASTAFLGGAGLTFAISSSIRAASDLNEEINKTRVVFRNSAGQILAWSRTSSSAFGLSRVEALRAAGAFGAMLETSGVATTQAARMSRALVQLAADMASFNNQDPSEMLDRIRSGLAGEAEPLRRFGVLLSEARVKNEAVRAGLARAGATLTEQQKVLARYNLILRDSGLQQGDFARTSGGLANQLRILRAQISDLLASIGTALLPVVLQLVRQLNAWLQNSENQARVQRAVVAAVNFTVNAIKALITAVRAVRHAFEEMQRFVQRVWNQMRQGAVRAALGIVEPFSHIPTRIGRPFRQAKEALLAEMEDLRSQMRRIGEESAVEFSRGFKSEFPDVGPGMTLDIPTTGAAPSPFTGLLGGGAGRTGISAEQRNRIFDASLARMLDRVQDLPALRAQLRRLDEIAAVIEAQIRKVRDVTRKLNLRDQLLAVRRQAAQIRDQIAAAFVDSLQLGIDRASVTARLDDDLRAMDALIAGLQRQIAQTGRTADLERQLLSAEQQRLQIVQQIADLRRQQRTARQFRALGLTATGEEPVPGVRALKRQLASVRDAIEGTFLDTGKTKSLLQRIRSVLGEGVNAVGRDVREKIQQILADLEDQLKNTTGTLTRFHKASVNAILAGAGLTPDQIRLLRSRLSQIGAGGTVHPSGFGAFGTALSVGGTIVVQHTSVLDGQVVERSVTKHQQKRRRRNPPQKRGSISP